MKPLKIDFQPFSRTLSLPFQEQKNDIHKTSQQVFSIHTHQQEMLLYFTRSPNLVIFVKVIFVIFDFENEKIFYKEYIYIYILYRREKVFLLLKMTKMTLTKMTHFPSYDGDRKSVV